MSKIDIVIPWTDRTASCQENLAATVDRLHHQLQLLGGGRIVIIETGDSPSVLRLGHADWHYIGGQANRSWGANVGFRKTDAPLVALLDADMFLPMDSLSVAVQQAESGCLGGKLSRARFLLTAEESGKLLAQSRTLELSAYECASRELKGGGRCAGAFWMEREFYAEIRGMNETYHPTGAEDLDMACRMKAVMSPEQWGPGTSPALHLWHDRSTSQGQRAWQKPLTAWVCALRGREVLSYIDNLSEDFGELSGPKSYWPPELEDTRPETQDAAD